MQLLIADAEKFQKKKYFAPENMEKTTLKSC